MLSEMKIVSGPSREELFDGLRLFSEKRLVKFVVENNGETVVLPTRMHSIQAEDGSGQSWNICFFVEVKALLRLSLPVQLKTILANKVEIILKGHYSTKIREGILDLHS